MDVIGRIERSLTTALARTRLPGCPPLLGEAMHHAVFPRGARVRPRLCLAVASACGDDAPPATDAAAAAIELLHCASLVHDDLPCFDDADTRRGRPSVHRAFGAPIAVLTGDALIVLAFQTLAQGAVSVPSRLVGLTTAIGLAVGVPCGIVAGQAWECESSVDLAQYQRQKTGALFAAATVMGAAAAGAESDPWRAMGDFIGEAYQVADDLLDATGDAATIGKPVGQDQAHHRPNAVAEHGIDGAVARLRELAEAAVDSVPSCPGQSALQRHILTETLRLVPCTPARSAA